MISAWFRESESHAGLIQPQKIKLNSWSSYRTHDISSLVILVATTVVQYYTDGPESLVGHIRVLPWDL